MSTLHFRAIGAVLGIAFTAACGTKEGSEDGYLATADSAAIHSHYLRTRGLAEVVIRSTMHTGDPRGMFAPALAGEVAFTPPATCTGVITGGDQDDDPVDTDQDGTPDHYRVEWGASCVSEDSVARVIASGHQDQLDTEVPGALVSDRGDMDCRTEYQNLTTGRTTIKRVTSLEEIVVREERATYTLVYLKGDSAIEANGTRTGTTLRDSIVATYDPDSGFVLTPLAVFPDWVPGMLSLHEDYRFEEGRPGQAFPGKFHFVISTPTPLHFDPGFGGVFDLGVLQGLMNGDAGVGFRRDFDRSAPRYEVFGETP